MVVPRSSVEVTHDDEFTLFAVTTFKRHSAEFQHKCREMKWTPRDYKYIQGGQEEERKEIERVGKDERKVWGEALRLGRTGWSESVMIWIHVLTLRVFVETVLRYGLPLEFVCGLIEVRLSLDNYLIITLILLRQPQNLQRKLRPRWTQLTRISVETHLGGTKRAGLRKTILHSHRKWLQLV